MEKQPQLEWTNHRLHEYSHIQQAIAYNQGGTPSHFYIIHEISNINYELKIVLMNNYEFYVKIPIQYFKTIEEAKAEAAEHYHNFLIKINNS